MKKQETLKKLNALTKRANTRLRQLEKSELTQASNAYRFIEKMAMYSDDAFDVDKKGRMKFSTKNKKKTTQRLIHELKIVEDFLNAKTSTVTGTKQKYEKAYKKITGKKIDKDFDAWAYAFSQGLFKKLNERFDSDMAIDVMKSKLDIGELTKENIMEIMDFLEKNEENEDLSLSDLSEFWEADTEKNPFE